MKLSFGVLAGSLLSLSWAKKAMASQDLNHKVVLITGGSKGLGFTLAQHLVKEGCRVALCARDEGELKKAQEVLGGEAYTVTCDVGKKEEVDRMITDVIGRWGQIDLLINDAGIIIVGAMESFTREEYKKAMDTMFWGIVNTTLSVLPHMKARHSGQIVNITSLGGKVGVPHLLPYDSAKFAAEGFSETSAAELRKDNIYVTTIIPGLMRTGSYVNAFFQRQNKQEFKLFSFLSSAPLVTLDADRAARKIIRAIKEKRAVKVIGIQAKLLVELHHFFPETTIDFLGMVSRFLPSSGGTKEFIQGEAITKNHPDAEVVGIRKIGKKAQKKHQLKGA